MKKLLLLLLLVPVLLSPNKANAQLSKIGTTASEFLRMPVGARSSAMSAFTASVNDPSSMVLNPAGLADIRSNQTMVEFTDWMLDMTHSYVGVAVPTKKGVVGVHVLAMNYGEFKETTAEAQGYTGRTFGAYSVSFGGSYAQYLIPQFSIGGTVKVIYEKIASTSASGIAFDVGTMYDTPFYGVRFGVSVTNVGSKMQMDGNDLIIGADFDRNSNGNYEPDAKLATNTYDLPLMLRVGLSWDAINNENMRATLNLDGNDPTNNVKSFSVGGEISLLNDLVQLRGGVPYIGQDDRTEKFNAGIGVKYKFDDKLSIGFNYTYHGYRYLSDINKMGLQIFF
ncbi:MAG: PorV/PorQ family protein [Balneolaceae bacterium]